MRSQVREEPPPPPVHFTQNGAFFAWLAPTARPYTSLGNAPGMRPRHRFKGHRPAPYACPVPRLARAFDECRARSVDGSGLQPEHFIGASVLGRCPRLVWGRAVGANAMHDSCPDGRPNYRFQNAISEMRPTLSREPVGPSRTGCRSRRQSC